MSALHQAPADLRTIGERLDQVERELNDMWSIFYKCDNQDAEGALEIIRAHREAEP